MGRGRAKGEGGGRQDFFRPRTPSASGRSEEPTVPQMDPQPSTSDLSHLTPGERSIMAAIDALHKKTDKIDAKMTHLESRFENIEAKVVNIDLKIAGLEVKSGNQEKQLHELEQKQIESQLSHQAVTGGQMRIERRLEMAENKLREANIRILGVPPQAEKEDVESFVFSLLSNLLEIRGEEESFYVVKAFRLPSRRTAKGEPSGGTILAVLSDMAERDLILSKAREKKELLYMGQRILLFPDISPFAQERRLELQKLRKQLAVRNVEAAIIYPAKLRVRHEGQTYIFFDVQAAKAFIDKLR